jgi:hypothetical protein
MLQYLRQEKKLHEALSAFILPKTDPKGKITKFEHSVRKDGQIEFKVAISSNGVTTTIKPEAKEPKKPTGGHKRKNVGFYDSLAEYLEERRKEGIKQIPIDEAYEELKFLYPGMTMRRFSIYVRDKRRQQDRRYKFDGPNNMFIL